MATVPSPPPPADDPDPDYIAFAAAASEALTVGRPLDTPADLSPPLARAADLLLALADARRLTPASLPATTVMPARLQPGGRVGRYEVVRQLGRGGAGAVFAARDPDLDRLVALKVLHPALTAHPSWGVRFRTEGPVLAKLRHPHVVQIFESGEADGLVYLAMELVEGPDLHTKLADGPLTVRQAAGWVAALADAVEHAHAEGVLHRDLKPANVLLDPAAGPKVADFGLAAPLDGGGTGLTATGEVVGTPNYLAPEMLAGAGDVRTDVYGMGAVLYECLTGRPPFAGSNPALTLMQVRASDPAPPRAVNPEVPADLNTVCLKCLAKRPEKRYPSAAALAADLRAYLEGRAIAARPPGAGERAVRWVRRRPALAAALAVGVAAVLIGLGGWLQYTRRLSDALEQVKREQAATAAALVLADKRAAQLGKTNQALLGVFRDLNVNRVRDNKVTVERALTDRLVALAEKLDGDALGGTAATPHLQYELGRAVRGLGFPEQALPLHTAAHRTLLAAAGPDDRDTVAAAQELATTLGALRRFDEALPLREEVFRRTEARYGPDAPETLAALGNLISSRENTGKDADPLPLREDLLARQTRTLGPDHPIVLSNTYNLAAGYMKHRQPERVVAVLEPAIGQIRTVRGADAPFTLTADALLGRAYLAVGRRDEGVALLADARRLLLLTVSPGHPRVLIFTTDLAKAYQAAGRTDAAREVLAESADAVASKQSRDAAAFNILVMAADVHEAAGEAARAEGWRAEAVEASKAIEGADSWRHAAVVLGHGRNLLAQKKWAAAEPVLLRAHELAAKGSHADVKADAAVALAKLYEGWGRPADAAKWASPGGH